RKKKKKTLITANVTNCKYELVRSSVEAVNIHVLKEDAVTLQAAYLFWYDSVVPMEKFQELKNYQRINHFPSMGEICRKDYLARNMAKWVESRPSEFNFVPRSWILPSEYNLLQIYAQDCRKKKRKSPTFIQKPSNGAMGNGIQLFRNPEKIQAAEQTIVQEYLDKPLLLDGYKIDLRLYCLVTHCDPLRAFLYKDGLVRLSTEKYVSPTEQNMDQVFMHLTNYSVNKQNEKFERHSDFDRGSKRSIKSLIAYLKNAGYDTSTLWRNICDLVVKTLIVASPHILHSYRMCRPGQSPHSDSVCFEILGFDIFLDRKLKPWLLEVNRAPSFGGDEKIDRDIKGGVIRDALRLVNIRASDKKRNLASQKAEAQRRLFRPSQSRLSTGNLSSSAQRIFIINRRKEELKEKLSWVRKEAAREDHENANLGGYTRIFPCIDRIQRERYTNLLSDAFQLFLQSRSAPFQKNIIDHYRPHNEDEILNMIEQCEAEEGIPLTKSKPLSSMPVLTPPPKSTSKRYSDESSSDSSDSSDRFNTKTVYFAGEIRKREVPPTPSSTPSIIAQSAPTTRDQNRCQTFQLSRASRCDTPASSRCVRSTIARPTSEEGSFLIHTRHNRRHYDARLDDDQAMALVMRGREDENTQRTLAALERTRIKYPGKNDDQADEILDHIIQNWKSHKPKIASYWLVKLDSVKRKKVIDIVRGNVQAIMTRIWRCAEVDQIRLMRLFNRVFNRMHSGRGQGLWNCFTTSRQGSNSWETIFSKSTDSVSEVELQCCRRIVRLSKDCLLIVYQFASDAK
uniref:Tubulin polyglutamylase TTLL7 n=1 Tax=Ciona savignyi TaxID=51511 RepID=H2ZKE6_CIOSA